MDRANSNTVTMDSKGRLLIPEVVRKEMDFEPGDVFFLKRDAATGTVQIARAINPFDELARAAVTEYEAGLTVSLEDALAMLDQDNE